MSEYYTQPSPLQLLERDFPDVLKTSIIVDAERCYCGACNLTVTPQDVRELDRCRNLDCGTGWVRTLTTTAGSDLPFHSFRLPVFTARSVWERKNEARLTRPSTTHKGSRRSIATVAINPKYL